MLRSGRITKFLGILSVFAVIASAAGLSTATAEGQGPRTIDAYFVPMHYMFDGKEFAPPAEQQGFIYEGSTYVPLRFISYALNHNVGWDQDTYTVTIGKPSLQEKLSIEDYLLNREVRGGGEVVAGDSTEVVPTDLEVYAETVTYMFNGETKEPSLDFPGFIRDGSLYVPMRFFAESVGQKIDWDQETFSVIAATDGAVKPTPSPSPTLTPSLTPSPTPSAAPSSTPQAGQMGGGGSYGGGSGGGAVKPSYDSLIAEGRRQGDALKARATSTFLGLYAEYKAAKPEAKPGIMARGNAALAGFNAEFAVILENLSTKLNANGYDTGAIAGFQAEYDSLKAVAQAALNN